ncbi:MAG: hypothetical protein O7C75_11195, partial [Verrucomicrobia bacterium]|nr:hypothetical protein [Verrucomicrobiota bacterium]
RMRTAEGVFDVANKMSGDGATAGGGRQTRGTAEPIRPPRPSFALTMFELWMTRHRIPKI